MNSVNIKRFVAAITYNGSNIAAIRKLITIQFSKIFNVKYIAHCLNLILHDFLWHNFADKTIKYYNIIVKCFKKSHIENDLLSKLITKYQITSGRLKTFVKTRWISVAEYTSSILRLKKCLNKVSNKKISFFFKKKIKNFFLKYFFFYNRYMKIIQMKLVR